MNGLTEFLLARIAEKEAIARECGGNEGGWLGYGYQHVLATDEGVLVDPPRFLAECARDRRIVERASRPVYTFGPADPPSPFAELTFSGDRIYADPYREVDVTEAYLQEVAAHSEPADPATLRDLAAVYADHPDFQEAWLPTTRCDTSA